MKNVPPEKAPPEHRLDLRALAPGLRASVAVGGATSNAGKTRAVERLLAGFRAAGVPTLALKVTRTHLATCPRGNEACGTCDSLGGDFEVVRDPARLATPGKDTARYLAAGAVEVRWLLVKPSAMAAGIRAALADFPSGAALVAEGNSFLDWTRPDLALMAVWDREPPKASATYVLDRVDAFVPRPGRAGAAVPAPVAGVPVLDDAALWPFVAERLGLAGTCAR